MTLNFRTAILILVVVTACELDDPISTNVSDRLVFSSDTIQFDTLLTDRLSITKRLRISNPNSKSILIDEILLGKGSASSFRTIINGMETTEIADHIVEPGDSILILIDVKLDPSEQTEPFLITDSILVNWNTNEANVKLRVWGQESLVLPKGVISSDTTWSAGKPVIIQDTLLVDEGATLSISAGTQVLFEPNAGLFIRGTMIVMGDSLNRVLFRNTRFDFNYIQAPGQWDAIYFLEGSTGNYIDFAVIENGRIGLRLGTPDLDSIPNLTVNHTIIRHMTESGVQAFNSDLHMSNTLIHNVGGTALFNVIGGSYSYYHCTFVNSPSFFFNDEPIVQIADFFPVTEEEIAVDRLSVTMINSIIWGSSEEEFFIVQELAGNYLDIRNNVIKSAENMDLNFVSSQDNFVQFNDPFAFRYDLDSLSIFIDAGIPGFVNYDLNGKVRDSLPDIGAFEYR